MRCPHCNTKNAKNAVFCANCSQWILGEYYTEPRKPAAVVSPRMAKNGAAKLTAGRIVIAAAIILVLIVGAVFLFWPDAQIGPSTVPTTSGPSTSTVHDDDVPPFTTLPPTTSPSATEPQGEYIQCQGYIGTLDIDGQLAFVIDENYVQTPLSPQAVSEIASSLDGTVGACLAGDLLYCIHDGKVQVLADHISSYRLSASGDGLAYVDTDGILWLYRNGQSVMVHQDEYNRISNYAISPDGRSVAYFTYPKIPTTGKDPNNTLSLYQDSESTKLGTYPEYNIIGVANGGQWLYIYGDSTLQIVDIHGTATELGEIVFLSNHHGGLSSSLSDTQDSLPSVNFSADQSQVLYCLKDGTYLSIDGQPGQKVSDRLLIPIDPELTQSLKTDFFATRPYWDLREKFYSVRCLSPFSGSSSAYTYSIHYLDETLTAQELIATADSFCLTSTGKQFYALLYDRTLCSLEVANGITTFMAIAVDVDDFVVSSDTHTLYLRKGDVLYRMDTDNMGTYYQVSSSIDTQTQLYTDADNFMYLYTDLTLSIYGKGSQRMSGITACFVTECGRLYAYTSNGSLTTFTNGDTVPIWYPSKK